MIDLDTVMVEFEHGNPPERALTPTGQKVVDWSKTLPPGGSQGIPGPRKQAAVASGFIYKFGDMEVSDFMSTADYNSVMAGNGPPRYDIFTGIYYDYGAYENGHPSGELICTDQSLLVEKGSKDGVVPPPEEETPPGFVPGTPGNERPDRPGRDERKAERDARQAERQPNQDARQAERDVRQGERQTKRDDRRDERDRNN